MPCEIETKGRNSLWVNYWSLNEENHGHQDSIRLADHPPALAASWVTRKMTEGWLIVTSVSWDCVIHHMGYSVSPYDITDDQVVVLPVMDEAKEG